MKITLITYLCVILLLGGGLCVAQTVTPTTSPVYGNITNNTIPLFNDGVLQGIENSVFTNSTNTVNPGRVIWWMGKPFSMYIGNWWILIVLGVLGAIMWYSQNGSPYLLILAFMVGNVVIWCFIPLDILGSLTSIIIFSLSLIIIAAFKGRST